MKRAFLSFCTALCLVLLCTSCEYGLHEFAGHSTDVDDRADRLLDITAPSPAGTDYSFIVISDVHFGKPHPDRHDDDFISKLKLLSPKPAFCICLGDIADHGRSSELEDYNAFVARIEAELGGGKVYSIVGNHDLYNAGWDSWKRLVYPNTSFYRFSIAGSLSFYFLDAGSGSLGNVQFKKLREAMRADSMPKIVSLHYPVYGSSAFMNDYYAIQNEKESTQIITLFAEQNVRRIFAGHVHQDESKDFTAELKEYVLPSYLEDRQFALVTVKSGTTISQELISY